MIPQSMPCQLKQKFQTTISQTQQNSRKCWYLHRAVSWINVLRVFPCVKPPPRPLTWASQASTTWYVLYQASSTLSPQQTAPWLRNNIICNKYCINNRQEIKENNAIFARYYFPTSYKAVLTQQLSKTHQDQIQRTIRTKYKGPSRPNTQDHQDQIQRTI